MLGALKLLWAIGRSSAAFAALFDQQNLYYGDTVSDSIFHQRSQVLGLAAAAAMDAEYPAVQPRSYAQIRRLCQLARTAPEVLLEAQGLLAAPRSSLAAGVLAGVLLAAGPQGQVRLEGQVEVVLALVEAILDLHSGTSLSDGDISLLKSYIHAGEATAPVPTISASISWQTPPEHYFYDPDWHFFSCQLEARPAINCMAPAALFGLGQDPRLACALRVLVGLSLEEALKGILCSLPEDGAISALDPLLPHIPGKAATMLQFVVTGFGRKHGALAQKVADRYQASGEEAALYMGLEAYQCLGRLLPALAHCKDREWMAQLQGVIKSHMQKVFNQVPHREIVQDYLDGQGAFADSAALLKPIRSEYRYLSNFDEALQEYQKMAGWDAFACRCIVLFCLTCAGYGTSKVLPLNHGKKEDLDAFVNALTAYGLPVRDCITVLAVLQEYWCQEEAKALAGAAVREHFVRPEGLEGLADAARSGSAAARLLAVEGLEALASNPDCAQGARRALVSCAGDSSKQVQERLAQCYIRHPAWDQDYLALLGGKKIAQRVLAAQVLADLGVERYRSALEQALAVEKNAKVMDHLTTLLKTCPTAIGAGGQTPEELAAQVLKGGKKRRVQWLLDQPLPTVHLRDEAHTPASEDQIAALFVAYADLGRMGRSDTAAAIAADLEPRELEALACQVWELWMRGEAPSKTKWVLPFTAVFGGAAMTPKLIHAIHDWPEKARGAIACDAVAALTVSPDPAALVTVDALARKFKFRQVKKAAAVALERAAQELGITTEELADRIVPTLNFTPDGTRVFDYGSRKFTVRLTPALDLAVTTETGKALKSLPSPGKSDDTEKAPAAYEAYKALKKQIKTTIAAQRARLELALSTQRCWDSAAWRKLFVENPVMHQFAISLIWGVYENGQRKETFRYMEDGSFNTVDEEEYTLPDEASIGLVHPIELEADTLAAWRQQLEDYEIVQSIEQLSRPIYRLPAEQAQATALETVAGRVLNSLTLMGKLQGMGWYRGSVLDSGEFYTFYREDPAVGVGVVLNFSGSFVGGDSSEVTVFDALFYRADMVALGSYCDEMPPQEHILSLGQVPARYYSEVVWQLERAATSSTETDPDWRDKKN